MPGGVRRELGALLKEAREECDALRAREQALAEVSRMGYDLLLKTHSRLVGYDYRVSKCVLEWGRREASDTSEFPRAVVFAALGAMLRLIFSQEDMPLQLVGSCRGTICNVCGLPRCVLAPQQQHQCRECTELDEIAPKPHSA